MTIITKHYKIRNRDTGLFSKGGSNPVTWSKTGKTWTTMGGLMNHLGYCRRYDPRNKTGPETFVIPASWELIEIEVRVTENNTESVVDFMKKRKPTAQVFTK